MMSGNCDSTPSPLGFCRCQKSFSTNPGECGNRRGFPDVSRPAQRN